jgi:hypothetical protein
VPHALRSYGDGMSAKRSAPKATPDPVLQAVANAAQGAPETEEEKRLVAAAKAEARFVAGADVDAMLAERARREK